MQLINILPHHARFYFEVYYFGKSPKEISNWNHNYLMRKNGVRALKKVSRKPKQMVRIARAYDEFCRMCPRNQEGDNYSDDWRMCDDANKMKDSKGELKSAEVLGLERVVDSEPISSATFFQLMEPAYKRIISLLEKNPDEPIIALLFQ